MSVSVSAEGASVFVTADSLSSREAAQQGIEVGQCKRRKRLVAMDVVFCMFSALIKRAVESHTAAQGVVSFDQVQVNFQLRLWGPEECSRRMGRWAGWGVCLGWMEGKVSQSVPAPLQQAMRCW